MRFKNTIQHNYQGTTPTISANKKDEGYQGMTPTINSSKIEENYSGTAPIVEANVGKTHVEKVTDGNYNKELNSYNNNNMEQSYGGVASSVNPITMDEIASSIHASEQNYDGLSFPNMSNIGDGVASNMNNTNYASEQDRMTVGQSCNSYDGLDNNFTSSVASGEVKSCSNCKNMKNNKCQKDVFDKNLASLDEH